MSTVKGTTGYAAVAEQYHQTTTSLPFEVLHRDFLPFIPRNRGLLADLGAGTGRDAHALSLLGHQVLAVEPLQAFRAIGQEHYPSPQLQWVDDHLPHLEKLAPYAQKIDFALSSGVWHHLSPSAQAAALLRIHALLRPKGLLALLLRHGPAGVGTHVFDIHVQDTLDQARAIGMVPLLQLEQQPSLLPHKKAVTWSRLVLQKQR